MQLHTPPAAIPRLPTRKTLPHGRPYCSDSVYFITICAEERGANTLALPAIAPSLWQAWDGYAKRTVINPLLFMVMPDHVHGLFRFSVDCKMGAVVAAWKRLTARRSGVAWQRDFFDHRLRGEESFEEKAAYIRANPQRAGLVADASQWPYAWPALSPR